MSMGQSPKEKDELKKEDLELSGHDFMEKIFGKRVMKEVDKIVGERSKDAEVNDESAIP